MDYIKEYRKATGTEDDRCIIRSKSYSHHLNHLVEMAKAAQADFPGLSFTNIVVTHYAGSYFNGTMGIEFVPPAKVPSDYAEIDELEPTK